MRLPWFEREAADVAFAYSGKYPYICPDFYNKRGLHAQKDNPQNNV
jgi:hypothetical protein